MSSTIQVAFKIEADDLRAIDHAVDEGLFDSRAQALREAVGTWLRLRRREEIDRQLERGYADVPASRSDELLAEVAVEALGDADLDW